MMSDWSLVMIDEIKADEKGAIAIGPFGSRMKSDCYVGEGIPVIRGKNITGGPTFDDDFVYITVEKANTLGSSNVYQHDLVFPHRGSIGEVGIILEDKRYVLSSSLMKMTCDKSKVNPKYLYYFFKSRLGRHELLKNASQVGTLGIGQPLASLKGIELKLPPLDIQDRIEEMLTLLDSKIELNHQTNQTLEQIAQAIFKSWFVNFEPTRAKIAAKQNGQDPERAAMAVISGKSLDELDQLSLEQQKQLKTTAALFPDALVDSGLGEIPEGWKASTLGEHFNVVMGQSPKGDTYNEDGEGMLFFQGRRDFGFRFPTPRVYTTMPKRVAQAGDTLISVRAPVGDRNMANQECCLGRGVAGIRHKSGVRSFTYAFIGYIEKNLSDSGSDGTVFSSINKKELGVVGFVAPSGDLLNLFEGQIDSLDQRVEVNSVEIEVLESLRNSLLPKLLSGKLDFT